eukprot:g52122.t1
MPFVVELTDGPCRRPGSPFRWILNEKAVVVVLTRRTVVMLLCVATRRLVSSSLLVVDGRMRVSLTGAGFDEPVSVEVDSGSGVGDLANRCDGPAGCVERRPVRRRLVGGVKGPVRSPDAVAVMRCPFYRRRCLLRETVESVPSAPSRQGVRGRRFVVDVRWGLQRCVGLVGRSFDASKVGVRVRFRLEGRFRMWHSAPVCRAFEVEVYIAVEDLDGAEVNWVANVAGIVVVAWVGGRVDDAAPLPSTSALLELLELFELVSSSSSDCCTGRVVFLELILEGRSDAVAVGPVGPGFGGVGADILIDE